VEWLVPWYSVVDDPAAVAAVERELGRELSVGHPLHGLPVRALGRRQDCDDVLYVVEDGTQRVAVVHLTWTNSPPERPPCPATIVFPSLEKWVADGMHRDHEECHA
jgi:hypothetical protein